jgi:hypothetical protein
VVSGVPAVVVLIAVVAACSALYLLPVLIGWARHAPDLAAIVVIDLALGWTFAGWVIALALALRSAYPAAPAIHVVQNLAPAPPTDWRGNPIAPRQLPPAQADADEGWRGDDRSG